MSSQGEQRNSIGQSGRLGRFGAWLAALALLLQVIVPLAPVQAAMVLDQDITASICHSSDTSGETGAPAKAKGEHCSFCQIHMGAKILPPTPTAWVAPEAAPRPTLGPQAAPSAPSQSVHQPQTQRGPPSFS
ncbi:hypothetical protein WV31_16070 [Magnetospirillum sp. ME-1]|uniref:DUF2946 family protein n=1 Tax=Magnetospirillum sp. ME-1 TaxID=1639348 RepID=UPI000A17B9C4|nr:DUF2946 family protein [Magnetospirillum sp. ME-1]ARJ67076.1 hypothetical protein WV31_16070 [Magnetospirillum sp. ME-1]